MVNKQNIPFIVTQKELNLIKLLRTLKFGKAIIHVEDAEPQRVEQLNKNIKL